jgi:prophage regulatory protein
LGKGYSKIFLAIGYEDMINNRRKGVDMSDFILRLPKVILRTGMSRSSIYSAMQQGTFPPSVHLGERSVGWLDSVITTWIDSRATARSKSHMGAAE